LTYEYEYLEGKNLKLLKIKWITCEYVECKLIWCRHNQPRFKSKSIFRSRKKRDQAAAGIQAIKPNILAQSFIYFI